MAEEFQVGDIVDVNGARAVVRYVGPAGFSPGEWIGVELETPDGKNDGSVKGVRYFECADKYGKFFKPHVPRLIDRPVQPVHRMQPKAPLKQAPLNASQSGSTSRTGTPTSTGVGRTPTTGSIQPSRSSTPGRPGSMGPAGTPKGAQQAARRASQVGGLQTQQTLSPAQGSPRPGSGASTSGSRTPVGETPLSPAAARSAPLNRLSVGFKTVSAVSALQRKQSSTSMSSGRTSPEISLARPAVQKGAQHGRKESVRAPQPEQMIRDVAQPVPLPASPELQRQPVGGLQRENEDLKAKLRVMEKKRMDDREKLQNMERIQQERDKYESIIQKMQIKIQPQQEELRELRKQVKEMSAHVEELENAKAEHEVIVEIATLDREMAEEQLEYMKTELEVLRSKAEELEMEVEVLREENKELSSEMSPEEKTSAGWIQMAKQNDRLKDALLRLKEITQQTENELKDHIKSLEADNEELTQYKEQYEQTKERLQQAESAVEDLRSQLDTALGAEEMLEELTDRNLRMNEQIEELRATIEDLESLKELNDELEINHVETEKQMQEELDYKDLIIAEQNRRIAQLNASTEEAEYTITRFRDLVMNLQNDLEDMRSSRQITEAEAAELNERSRSMMDLNLKLQMTAVKAQNKTIDLELGRMEAREAIEHLSIVQMFLPEAFLQERDSVLALLRFKRVAFKANLLHTFIKERLVGQSSTAVSGQDDSFMAACEVCEKLTWIEGMCDRFVQCISSCDVHQFAKFREAIHELDPVERALNNWIEGFRRDELKVKQCAMDLQRTIAVVDHMGEINLTDTLEGYAQELQMKVQLMQSHMEGSASAVSHIKAMVANKVTPTMDEEELASLFAKKADSIVSHCRSAKVVVGKVARSLGDLKNRSLSLTIDTRQSFEQCEEATKKIADYTRALGDKIVELLYGEEGRTEPIHYIELQNVMYKTTEKVLTMVETDTFGALSKELRTLTNLLVDLQSIAGDLDMTAEFEKVTPPWVVRAQELKNTKVVNVDVEDEMRRLKDDIRELVTQIRVREKSLEEAAVKIELLESRMQKVGNQAEKIEQLEKHLVEASTRESKLDATIEQLTSELTNVEKEAAKWKKLANDKRTAGDIDRSGQEKAVATAREVAGLKSEIANLRGAVNFLREENARIKQVDLTSTNSWLWEPIKPSAIVYGDGEGKTKGAKERLWKEEMVRESQDLFSELIQLATESKVIDLNETPENRKAWRPLSTTPSYVYWRQREQYEALAGWRDSIIQRTRGWEEKKAAVRAGVGLPEGKKEGTKSRSGRLTMVGGDGPTKRDKSKSVAKMEVYHMYPGLEMKRGLAPKVDVVITDAERWDEMKEVVGFA